MKILLVHPVRLPPRDYGGVERVVLWLAKGLLERGHQVFIAAEAGSVLPTGCQLIAVSASDPLEDWLRVLPDGVDLCHFMAPLGEKLWNSLPLPALLTVHGNGQPGEKFPKNSVFLSQDHAKRHDARVYVYNGIDPAEYLFEPQSKKDWNLFLSKTSWSVKNVRGAARWSELARRRLKIAGGHRPWALRFKCQFSSYLDWVGPVAGRKKAEYLTQAQTLVFPVRWPEPFGLVVAEALMSGTPVIGSPQGSLVELISPQVGVLPRSPEEWIEVLSRSESLASPEVCRNWAMSRFHYLGMAENYEKIYRQVCGGADLHASEPKTLDISENLIWRNKNSSVEILK
jgi:glycosyltransferase involved in cell wall biosynthesis